ncbi:MAG TPA: ribosome assembly RNA-binding protein YhbY [Clostridiales bacterium]|nr:ribosome assembly RNA-binding protein YhbY [Clostridiales bacterium]
MLTGKQKRYLRSKAMTMDALYQIGKEGLGENFTKQIDDALEARELIKIKILKNSAEEAGDAGRNLSAALGAELVQTIGHCIVLYRKSKNKPKIELP